MEEGQIEVDSIVQIRFADITPALARESGFASKAALLATARHGVGRNVYLVRFHYLPPGLMSSSTRKTTRDSRSKTTLAVSPAFKAFVLDQLEELGDVVMRSMFGGIGLYRRGTFFGILARDTLYLRADDWTRPELEAAGSRTFKPYPNRSVEMSYYSVPIGVLESPPELVRWCRQALAAAARAATRSRPPRRGD
jgi:DNA transformation protein